MHTEKSHQMMLSSERTSQKKGMAQEDKHQTSKKNDKKSMGKSEEKSRRDKK